MCVCVERKESRKKVANSHRYLSVVAREPDRRRRAPPEATWNWRNLEEPGRKTQATEEVVMFHERKGVQVGIGTKVLCASRKIIRRTNTNVAIIASLEQVEASQRTTLWMRWSLFVPMACCCCYSKLLLQRASDPG